ncbi:carbohydrate ABC transporter permease [Cohnella terricola]|uniref:Sugar ABC transporter permease n=1 Tax=Cohnella terricola TaxID=1289167 RepID=A0A559JTU3_9BACL|nr:sugar ABC transporter permease [Cohnella terricola]TVY03302.1 sugar ABC transporter permease [Cohnella terricola]
MNRSTSLKISRLGLIGLLGPSLAIYAFVMIVPLFLSFYYSLTDWMGGPTKTFIGLHNYELLLKDEDFWHSFKNNVIILILTLIVQLGLAFLLTTLFVSKTMRLKELHRTVIFFPVVLSAVVVGFVWQMIYSHDYGVLNAVLKFMGLESAIRPWLDDPKIVIYLVTAPLIWQYLGVPLMIFMSAVQGIPKDIYETCELDGCTGFKKARYITFPLIYDTIKVVMMLSISSNMLVFSHIYVMTGGGPGTSSMVLAQYAYKTSFSSMQLGYGSAVTIGMFILSFGIVILFKRLAEVRNS